MNGTLNDFFGSPETDKECIHCDGKDGDLRAFYNSDGELSFWFHPECERKHDEERARRDAERAKYNAKLNWIAETDN